MNNEQTTANEVFPSMPLHPGELIKDELECRGITQKALAGAIGVSPSVVCEILNGRRAVNTQFALLLEAALGIEADIWISAQERYNRHKASLNTSFMAQLAKVRAVASLL